MKVRRPPMIPYIVSIQELEDVMAPEVDQHESIAESFSLKMFDYIKAGNERIAIVLRSDGLTYREIGWIMGIETSTVESLIYKVRKRLQQAKISR